MRTLTLASTGCATRARASAELASRGKTVMKSRVVVADDDEIENGLDEEDELRRESRILR